VAQDLSNTVFLRKPEAVDPIAHPWIFLAESRGSELGADRVKFVTPATIRAGAGCPNRISRS
jgi:hypothetical protein